MKKFIDSTDLEKWVKENQERVGQILLSPVSHPESISHHNVVVGQIQVLTKLQQFINDYEGVDLENDSL